MKLVLATAFPRDPSAPRGGVEAVSVTLTRALARFDDLDIHVVTVDRACERPEECACDGAVIHRLPRLGRTTLSSAVRADRRQVLAILRALQPDVVHAHDVYGLMVEGLAVPRVFTVHGFIYADTLVNGERFAWLRSRIWRRFETAGWADQPHIISISPYVRERLAGVTSAVIHDIDNPIPPAFFDVAQSGNAPTIFSAALIGPRKNTLALVQAVAQLASSGLDVELRLAGEVVDPAYGEKLHALIADHGLNRHVQMLGRLTTDQIMRELSHAGVFALVSLEENSPMGIEEAMAAGVPIVTSNRCGMPYMIRDGESGFLVNPHDPADIADRLRVILSDRTLRDRFGEASRRIARERFHPEVVARRTREVYDRAVRSHQGHNARRPS